MDRERELFMLTVYNIAGSIVIKKGKERLKQQQTGNSMGRTLYQCFPNFFTKYSISGMTTR